MWYRVPSHLCYCHFVNCKHEEDPKEDTGAQKSVIASDTPEHSKLQLRAKCYTKIMCYGIAPKLAQIHLANMCDTAANFAAVSVKNLRCILQSKI